MTTQSTTIGEAWVNLQDDLSLENGISYTLENTGSSLLYLVEAAAEPTVFTRGHLIKDSEERTFYPREGMGVWVRARNASTSLAVSESEFFNPIQRENKVLYDDSAAGTGEWIPLTESPNDRRPFFGNVASGDTIFIDVTTVADATAVAAEDMATPRSYTENFCDVLVGDWTFARVRKEGTAGNSKVQGSL